MVAWSNKNGYDWCEILDIDSMVGRLLQPDLRPGKWAGDDIRRAMGNFTADNRRHDDQRRGVTLVHNDLAGSTGVSPAISISFQPILPGEKLAFHRHNYVAIYYWVEGEGYTANDDEGIDREETRVYCRPSHQACDTHTRQQAQRLGFRRSKTQSFSRHSRRG